MAGYIIALGNDSEALSFCFKNGVYGTYLTFSQQQFWNNAKEGTLADYKTMKEGDNIYFFKKRKIYGIGRIVNILDDCKYFNYPQAYIPKDQIYDNEKDKMLLNMGEESPKIIVICLFEPSPLFFKKGVDMDDALNSSPYNFRMLRAFEKLSFIKIDDEENKALFDILLKTNEDSLSNTSECYDSSSYKQVHNNIKQKIQSNVNGYRYDLSNILSPINQNGFLKHEMGLELGLIY